MNARQIEAHLQKMRCELIAANWCWQTGDDEGAIQHELAASIALNLALSSNKPKPKPCRCDRLSFPHRRTKECPPVELDWSKLAVRDPMADERAAFDAREARSINRWV